MNNENNYVAAELSPSLVNRIKSFEETLSEESNKKVVVIAYEKDDDQLNS